jgi:hypothetical protein
MRGSLRAALIEHGNRIRSNLSNLYARLRATAGDPMSSGERKIDVRLALRAYQSVLEFGVRDAGGYHLEGLAATSDFDGYTVTLSDGAVTVRLLFHSQVAIDAPNGKALEKFIDRLQRIAQIRTPRDGTPGGG